MTAVGAAGCPLMLPTMIRRDFWACAIAALGKASPGVAPRAFELIKMGADLRQVVLPTLLNELAAIDYQIALILDDYHLVENRAVHKQVGFVVERMFVPDPLRGIEARTVRVPARQDILLHDGCPCGRSGWLALQGPHGRAARS